MRLAALLFLSGFFWLLIGLFLLSKGIALSMSAEGVLPSILLALGFFLGYLKGRFVFFRLVNRTVDKLTHLDTAPSLRHLFSPRYLLTIALMMSLGMGMNVCNLSPFIRGPVDVAVGFALLLGAGFYFKRGFCFARSPNLRNHL